MRPRVTAVILNTNRRDDTLACLRSLEASERIAVAIVVLDNASTDGSVAAIRQAHPSVEVVSLTENLGYAGNNNVGIRLALARGSDWVLVLNEDTVMAPDCLAALVEAGDADRRIGVLGPMVYHHDEPDVIQSAGGALHARDWRSSHLGANETDRGQFADARDVAWVSGCAILVRREMVDDVGALDPRFFYYWEETEWCLRAGRRGWRVRHVPAARLWHKGVARDYRPGPGVTYYDTRNRFLMMASLGAPLAVRMRVWVGVMRTLASWSLREKWADRREHRDAMRQGALDHLRGRYGKRRD